VTAHPWRVDPAELLAEIVPIELGLRSHSEPMRPSKLTRRERRAIVRTLRTATQWRALPSPIITVRVGRRRLYVCVAEGCCTVWETGAAADSHALAAHPWGVRVAWEELLNE
jgi:hypothetical protein